MAVELTNFRTLGGYPAADGRIKDGLLYRGGQIADLDQNQILYLKDKLAISRVVDFRSQAERKQYPDSVWGGVDYDAIDVLVDAKKSGVSIEGMINNAGDISQVMLATYAQLVTSPSAQKGYHQFMTALVDDPKPTFFHCFAGKDRTGVAAALILKTAGVSDNDIFEDYLKTNESRKKANEQIIHQLADKLTTGQQKALSQALVVDRRYLQHFFVTINQQYGHFENYLKEGLGLEKGFVPEFRHQYVV
ncbi:tyrosine-protein phosphatase [Lentilactobacillus hilgardii]|uniref:tyrosine-protein phosphatase n=1 Tax=Lentilactobacillus hilgardii TaxID=1588 RepID=UPI0021A9433D|nr:tyrosine-protein phosphatase [Lentilactobacillus hilgardii]MCT3399939.1 tyrosine-protein phosphatase [Lentilactobacillus hilgardii]MCV3742291.1 tyrosine-protein phosphatase [Lentilactobacillus hilgardii]